MSSPRTRSRRAALTALLAVSDGEAERLRAVLIAKDSSSDDKQKAQADLDDLTRSILLRIADIHADSDAGVHRMPQRTGLPPAASVQGEAVKDTDAA